MVKALNQDTTEKFLRLNESTISSVSSTRRLARDIAAASNGIESLAFEDSLLRRPGYASPTFPKMRPLISSIRCLKSLKRLEIIGGMSLDSIFDVKVLAAAIKNHPSLEDFSMADFVVHARDHEDAGYFLDPLLDAASTIPQLTKLTLSCQIVHRPWSRSFLSKESLFRICQLPRMNRLNLSNLGLRDQHFYAIAQALAEKKTQSNFEALVLNDNQQSEKGVQALVELLGADTQMRTLDFFNADRLDDELSSLIVSKVESSANLHSLKANFEFRPRKEIEYLLSLNRLGRSTILNPNSPAASKLKVLWAARSTPSASLDFLREDPALIRSVLDETHQESMESRYSEETQLSSSNHSIESEGSNSRNLPAVWRRFWYRSA